MKSKINLSLLCREMCYRYARKGIPYGFEQGQAFPMPGAILDGDLDSVPELASPEKLPSQAATRYAYEEFCGCGFSATYNVFDDRIWLTPVKYRVAAPYEHLGYGFAKIWDGNQ